MLQKRQQSSGTTFTMTRLLVIVTAIQVTFGYYLNKFKLAEYKIGQFNFTLHRQQISVLWVKNWRLSEEQGVVILANKYLWLFTVLYIIYLQFKHERPHFCQKRLVFKPNLNTKTWNIQIFAKKASAQGITS